MDLVALTAHPPHAATTAAPATTTAAPVDLIAPAEPTGLVATPGDGQISLTWDANGEPDVAEYQLFRDGVLIATVTGTSYDDTGLTNGVDHTYELVAVDTSGNVSIPANAIASAADPMPPAEPTGLVATPGDGRITLAWGANA